MPPPANSEDDSNEPNPTGSPLNHINFLSEVILRSEGNRRNLNRYSSVIGSEIYSINANPIPDQLRNIYGTGTNDGGRDSRRAGDDGGPVPVAYPLTSALNDLRRHLASEDGSSDSIDIVDIDDDEDDEDDEDDLDDDDDEGDDGDDNATLRGNTGTRVHFEEDDSRLDNDASANDMSDDISVDSEDFRFDEMIQSDPEFNLRSDIQSNEHLLLSSARLNPTNTNTLISNSGVSLRRSNAIRNSSRASERSRHNSYRRLALPLPPMPPLPQQTSRGSSGTNTSNTEPDSTAAAAEATTAETEAAPSQPPLPPIWRLNAMQQAITDHVHRDQVRLGLTVPERLLSSDSRLGQPTASYLHPPHPHPPSRTRLPYPRRRTLAPTLPKTVKTTDLEWYSKVMKSIVNDLQATKLANGVSPLFHTKSHKHTSGVKSKHGDIHRLNIDEALDELKQRRFRAKRHSPGPQYYPQTDPTRAQYSSYEPTSIANERSQPPEESKRARKRKPHGNLYNGSERKRQKTSASVESISIQFGTKINLNSLSPEHVQKIAGPTYSSYFTSGCNYSLRGLKKQEQALDLSLSSVDYDSGEILGSFSSTSLIDALKFFFGNNTEARDPFINKSLDTIMSLTATDCSRNFDIPVSGSIVDFLSTDLRFLQPDPREIKAGRKTVLQVSEWTKIEPFNQFQEAYLYKTAWDIYKHLKYHIKSENLKIERGMSLSNRDGRMLWYRQRLVYTARGVNYYFNTSVLSARGKDTSKKLAKAQNDKDKGQRSPSEIKKVQELRKQVRISSKRGRFEHCKGSFRDKMVYHLTECLTCVDNCLANIHLNYVCFTLTVDLCALIEQILHHRAGTRRESQNAAPAVSFESSLAAMSQPSPPSADADQYFTPTMPPPSGDGFADWGESEERAATPAATSEATKAVLLCSINRKTGQLSVHNTRGFLEHTNICSETQSRSSFRPGANEHWFASRAHPPAYDSSSDDEELIHSYSHYNSECSRRRGFADPYSSQDFETTLVGSVCRRSNKATSKGQFV